MATRLYAQASQVPSISPAFAASGWVSTADAVRRTMATTKVAATEQISGNVGGNINDNSLCYQLVSPPLSGAQTVSGTLSVVSRSRELASTDNVNKRWRYCAVFSGDGLTLRGVAMAAVATTSTTELSPTTLQGQQHALSAVLTSVSAQDGDVIVVEVGLGESATGTTPQWTTEIGGDGTDHANANSDTTGTVPWVEFSANLVFQSAATAGPPPPPPQTARRAPTQRRRTAQPTVVITVAAAPPVQPQSRRGPLRLSRRGSIAQPVPVQIVIAPSPSPPPANIPRARSWWRPKPRYGRAEPPWRPPVIAPSPPPPVTAVPRARRWPLPRRRAQATQPVPPAPAPQVTVWVPPAIPARRRPVLGRRSRAPQQVPRVVVQVPAPPTRRRPLLTRRRGQTAQPVPAVQVVIVPAVPPPAVGQRKRRWWPFARRGTAAAPPPQAAVAPVLVDLEVKVGGLSVRTFTGSLGWRTQIEGGGGRTFTGPASSRTTAGGLSAREAVDGTTL